MQKTLKMIPIINQNKNNGVINQNKNDSQTIWLDSKSCT